MADWAKLLGVDPACSLNNKFWRLKALSKGINLDHYTDTYETLIKLKRDLKDRPIYVWGAKITGGAVCSVLIR